MVEQKARPIGHSYRNNLLVLEARWNYWVESSQWAKVLINVVLKGLKQSWPHDIQQNCQSWAICSCCKCFFRSPKSTQPNSNIKLSSLTTTKGNTT